MPDKKQPLILAHRGATRYAPENSLEAIEKAITLGLPGMEIDLRQTADKQCVCFHDENLERLTGLDKKVSEVGSTHLRQLTLQSTAIDNETPLTGRIAFLEDVLERVPKEFLLNVEIKGSQWKKEDLASRLLLPIKRKGLLHQTLVSCFHPLPLLRLKKLEPAIKIGFLVHDTHLRLAQPGWATRWVKPYSIHPKQDLATPGRIALWKEAGYAIFVWTVNDRETFAELTEAEVDGVITDIPEELQQIAKSDGK